MGNELVPQRERVKTKARAMTVYSEPPPQNPGQQQSQPPPHQQQRGHHSERAHGGGPTSSGYVAAQPYEEFAAWQVALFFGVAFLVLMLVLAIFFPVPTPFQYKVFKTALALSAAGVGGALPGVFNINGGWIRIGGALLFFLIVYLLNPAGYIIHWVRPEAVVLDDRNRTSEYGVGGTEYKQEGEALRKIVSEAGVRSAVYECDETQKPYPALQYHPDYAVPLVSEDDVSIISDINPRLVVVYDSTLSHYGREKVLKALAPLRAKILLVALEYPPTEYRTYSAAGAGVQTPLSDETVDERLKGRVERFVVKGGYVYKNVEELKARVRELLGKDRQPLRR